MLFESSVTHLSFEVWNYIHIFITISLNKIFFYYNTNLSKTKGFIIKLFIYFIFSTLVFANTYPSFSDSDFIYIQKKYGKIAKNRVIDYQNTILSYKNKTKNVQLNKVNLYLNQLLPQYDSVIQKKEDYWASPKEFLNSGFGDCEDYVIIKYFSLLKLGFDKNKLYFTVVEEQYTKGYHMVLSYFKDSGKSPFILDNLSFRILTLKQRKDLKVINFINHNGVFIINNKNQLIKTHNKSSKYQELIMKIKKEKAGINNGNK